MRRIGRTMWAIAGGHIPMGSSGTEPEFTSRDTLCLLNTTDDEAHVHLTIYHRDREPVGPYKLTVAPRRVRHVRLNDLIDPEAVPLDAPYGGLIESDVPLVVQFLRQDTRQAANAISSIPAFAAKA